MAGHTSMVSNPVRASTVKQKAYIPVPLRVIVCGEPVALSVIVMVAGSEPDVVGAKCPWMMQLAPAARLAPQLLAKT